MLSEISAYILPLTIVGIVIFGWIKKVNVYSAFVDGAKDGLKIVVDVLPTLAGLMVAVGVFRASGAFDLIGQWLAPVLNRLGLAVEVVSLMIVKMFSSSASTGLLLDVYEKYGVDSYNGNVASLVLSSTETIFYTMSVYFMAAKVTKTRYTLAGALLSTLAGTIASLVLAGFM